MVSDFPTVTWRTTVVVLSSTTAIAAAPSPRPRARAATRPAMTKGVRVRWFIFCQSSVWLTGHQRRMSVGEAGAKKSLRPLPRAVTVRTMRAMSILVVDDERAVRESLQRALELEGYHV